MTQSDRGTIGTRPLGNGMTLLIAGCSDAALGEIQILRNSYALVGELV